MARPRIEEVEEQVGQQVDADEYRADDVPPSTAFMSARLEELVMERERWARRTCPVEHGAFEHGVESAITAGVVRRRCAARGPRYVRT